MTGVLRVLFATLFLGASAFAPVYAGVPVPLLPLADSSGECPDESASTSQSVRATDPARGRYRAAADPLARSCLRPSTPAPCRTPAHSGGSFYSDVAVHIRFCVWRE